MKSLNPFSQKDSIAYSLDKSCTKNEQQFEFEFANLSFFYRFQYLPFSVGRILVIASPSEKKKRVQSLDEVQN